MDSLRGIPPVPAQQSRLLPLMDSLRGIPPVPAQQSRLLPLMDSLRGIPPVPAQQSRLLPLMDSLQGIPPVPAQQSRLLPLMGSLQGIPQEPLQIYYEIVEQGAYRELTQLANEEIVPCYIIHWYLYQSLSGDHGVDPINESGCPRGISVNLHSSQLHAPPYIVYGDGPHPYKGPLPYGVPKPDYVYTWKIILTENVYRQGYETNERDIIQDIHRHLYELCLLFPSVVNQCAPFTAFLTWSGNDSDCGYLEFHPKVTAQVQDVLTNGTVPSHRTDRELERPIHLPTPRGLVAIVISYSAFLYWLIIIIKNYLKYQFQFAGV